MFASANGQPATRSRDVVEHGREQTALAVLRGGRSYAEAAEISGLPEERVMLIWAEATAKR
jgi:hypothetical protein